MSIIEQHLRFVEKRENHAMCGALLTTATGDLLVEDPRACGWASPRRAG